MDAAESASGMDWPLKSERKSVSEELNAPEEVSSLDTQSRPKDAEHFDTSAASDVNNCPAKPSTITVGTSSK
jgi:hypothetical protein